MHMTHDDAHLREVGAAIMKAWERFGDVPFPLYESEALELAKAAISAHEDIRAKEAAIF